MGKKGVKSDISIKVREGIYPLGPRKSGGDAKGRVRNPAPRPGTLNSNNAHGVGGSRYLQVSVFNWQQCLDSDNFGLGSKESKTLTKNHGNVMSVYCPENVVSD